MEHIGIIPIREISISLIRKGNQILVYKRNDDITGQFFFRLVGGCIEFGEASKDALKREFFEELSLEIEQVALLEKFESIFVFNGLKRHEVVYLFESSFVDKDVYNQSVIHGLEGERKFEAVWKNISDFKIGSDILVPEKILDYI